MSNQSSSYSVWNNFFLSAGIPNTVANQYAVTFSQHRMSIDMLKEITKEILNEMGIKAMGDIIAILRHAKDICTQDELKLGMTKSSHHNVSLDNVSTRQTTNLAQRMPITTTTTTTRSGPTVTVGNKIQSRISLKSGALIASTQNTTVQSSAITNKRTSSTIPASLAKRLKPSAETYKNGHETEKTLTVHYPSSLAMAKAYQRISNNAGSSVPTQARNLPIMMRLGATLPDTSRFKSESSNASNANKNPRDWSRQEDKNSNKNHIMSNLVKSGRLGTINKTIGHPNRDTGSKGHTPRLKSTVFHRLGNGPR